MARRRPPKNSDTEHSIRATAEGHQSRDYKVTLHNNNNDIDANNEARRRYRKEMGLADDVKVSCVSLAAPRHMFC